MSDKHITGDMDYADPDAQLSDGGAAWNKKQVASRKAIQEKSKQPTITDEQIVERPVQPEIDDPLRELIVEWSERWNTIGSKDGRKALSDAIDDLKNLSFAFDDRQIQARRDKEVQDAIDECFANNTTVTDEQIVEILKLSSYSFSDSCGMWYGRNSVQLGTTEELGEKIRSILNKETND